MLTGDAKKEYQRGYMRDYMRKRRALGLTSPNVKTRSPGSRRFRILQRDNFRCQYCGRTPKDDIKLEVDHIIPICKGGDSEDSNLITACFECNRAKAGNRLNYDAEQSITPEPQLYDKIEQLTTTSKDVVESPSVPVDGKSQSGDLDPAEQGMIDMGFKKADVPSVQTVPESDSELVPVFDKKSPVISVAPTIRERITAMSIPEVLREFGHVPNWRRELG